MHVLALRRHRPQSRQIPEQRHSVIIPAADAFNSIAGVASANVDVSHRGRFSMAESTESATAGAGAGGACVGSDSQWLITKISHRGRYSVDDNRKSNYAFCQMKKHTCFAALFLHFHCGRNAPAAWFSDKIFLFPLCFQAFLA